VKVLHRLKWCSSSARKQRRRSDVAYWQFY
jgi:hypothetical protein